MPAFTSDQREIVMSSLFPPGVMLCFSGSGDDRVNGRGKGSSFAVSTQAMGSTQIVSWNWNDSVYMAGGRLTHDAAMLGDRVSFGLTATATPYVLNMMGPGNGNLNGQTGMISPALNNLGNVNINDGISNLGMAPAVPVPDPAGMGLWMWSEPETGLGTITPTPAEYMGKPTLATYNLYVVDVPLAVFVSNVQIVGSRSIDFTLPAIKPQLILPHWQSWAVVRTGGAMRSTPVVVTWSITLARMVTL